MSIVIQRLARQWSRMLAMMLPFADAATKEVPLSRLLRLSCFQISVGMASVLLTGTLNRVLIVELGLQAWVVAMMVALPLVAAPFRALIGFKSDTHRSFLGWRRGPYIWFGSMMMFGGFSFMPFALLVMTGHGHGPAVVGQVAAALSFLLVGAGIHTTQTAGLALADDISPPEVRPRVVALLYVMLLVGMLISSVAIGQALATFSPLRLAQVVQGAAVLVLVLNVVAMWGQEVRNPTKTAPDQARPRFEESWRAFAAEPGTIRLLVAIGLGSAAFGMQDVLLEPFGGQIMHMSVGQTTFLTAFWALGGLSGFGLAAHWLGKGIDPHRLAGAGVLIGLPAFVLIVLAAPIQAAAMFSVGAALIGLGSGLFAVSALTAMMRHGGRAGAGLALGAWGAVQATATGAAILVGGAMRDGVGALALAGALGETLRSPVTGYVSVYLTEIALLFATLVAIGPLARHAGAPQTSKFGLPEFPTA
ncbi:MAG: BCD family MFS transporter [Alphaproteobacteria bacterium]|nr:BCD family MFS transporter [Alphaproteobacteria bacterium]